MLIFTAVINLSLPFANTSSNTYRVLVISHGEASKAYFQRANCYSVSYLTIVNIKRFNIALKLTHFKINKNNESVNLINFVVLNSVIGNGA